MAAMSQRNAASLTELRTRSRHGSETMRQSAVGEGTTSRAASIAGVVPRATLDLTTAFVKMFATA